MKKLRFLVSLITKNNDYQLEQAVAAEEAAKSLGVDVQILFADSDAITQSTQVLRVIQGDPLQRPDGIVVEPVGGTALPQVASAAVNANIGWAVINRGAEYIPSLRRTSSVPVFSISSDQTEVGRIQGRQFTALLPRGGSILYIQGPSENAAAKDRALGMRETLSANIQVATLRGQWTEESASRAVSSWLRLNVANKSRINLVGAQNDAMAIGARKTFQDVRDDSEREYWLHLPFTGCDGVPKTGQAWVRTGNLAATVVIPPDAGRAIQFFVQALQGGAKIPERHFTEPKSFPSLESLTSR
jgi:ABC-type sugar transport system substrate-binding protein